MGTLVVVPDEILQKLTQHQGWDARCYSHAFAKSPNTIANSGRNTPLPKPPTTPSTSSRQSRRSAVLQEDDKRREAAVKELQCLLTYVSAQL